MILTLQKLLACIFVLAIGYQANAQQQTKIGLNLLIEKNDAEYYFGPGIGLSVERQLTKRSGIESGLYYRTSERSISVFFDQATSNRRVSVDLSERYLSLPILYKFHSKIINFSVGPTLDYFVGWNQVSGRNEAEINEYSISPDLSIGAMLKLSKTIRLGERASLEPELRLNPNITYGVAYYGFGIPLKFIID